MPSVLKALRQRRIYLKQDLKYIYFYLFSTSYLPAAVLRNLLICCHVWLWQPSSWQRGRKRIYPLKGECDRNSQKGHRRISALDNTAHLPWASTQTKCSGVATRVTPTSRDISRIATNWEAKHCAWCYSSWAFAFEVHVHQRISKVFYVRYFIDCVEYSFIRPVISLVVTWRRSPTEHLWENI